MRFSGYLSLSRRGSFLTAHSTLPEVAVVFFAVNLILVPELWEQEGVERMGRREHGAGRGEEGSRAWS